MDETNSRASSHIHKETNIVKDNGVPGSIYGMAFIGSLIYFIQHLSPFWIFTSGFWMVIIAIVKAIFWPAILIFKLLEFLKM